jgi:hypothetical protein
MAKYDTLRDHLMQHKEREFEMTFSEIEKVLGSTLPPSAGLMSHKRRPMFSGSHGRLPATTRS